MKTRSLARNAGVTVEREGAASSGGQAATASKPPPAKRRKKACANTSSKSEAQEEQMEELALAVRNADVQQLTAMGYSARKARDALDRSAGVFERALEHLLSGCK